jgi:hypothetical protein
MIWKTTNNTSSEHFQNLIEKRGNIDNPNTLIHDRAMSWRMGTSIKSGGDKLLVVLRAKFSLLLEWCGHASDFHIVVKWQPSYISVTDMVDGNKIIIIFYFINCVCANYKCCFIPSKGPDLGNKVCCILYIRQEWNTSQIWTKIYFRHMYAMDITLFNKVLISSVKYLKYKFRRFFKKKHWCNCLDLPIRWRCKKSESKMRMRAQRISCEE